MQAPQELSFWPTCVRSWTVFTAEIFAAWSVEDGVRVVWEVVKMVVVVVVKVVLLWV